MREETHDGTTCVEMLNFECHIFDGPVSHGSMSIVKVFCWIGERGGEGRPCSG